MQQIESLIKQEKCFAIEHCKVLVEICRILKEHKKDFGKTIGKNIKIAKKCRKNEK